MSTFTVRIERQQRDGGVWNVVVPDEVVTDDRTARELCDEITLLQTTADNHKWRVSVWSGGEAKGQAAAESYSSRSL